MSADDDGKVSQNADNPMNHVGLDLDNLALTVLDFFNIPSPHITPYHMLDIYKKIKETAGQYDGVVITHGTDTLEETAYFLDTMNVPEICCKSKRTRGSAVLNQRMSCFMMIPRGP